jgi:hypothetical protein
MAQPTNFNYLDTALCNLEKVFTDTRTITIPAATAAATSFGIIPVKRGYSLEKFNAFVDDLDTGTTVTLELGVLYRVGSTATDAPSAFVAASTIARTGGELTNADNLAAVPLISTAPYVFLDDGWITLTVSAGPTTTAGKARLVAELSA